MNNMQYTEKRDGWMAASLVGGSFSKLNINVLAEHHGREKYLSFDK